MKIILNVICNIQHKFDKARAYKGVQGNSSEVNLMIVDIPKGLLVPMVSSPPTSILEWNTTCYRNFLSMVFDFGSLFVHNNGVLLLLHMDDF